MFNNSDQELCFEELKQSLIRIFPLEGKYNQLTFHIYLLNFLEQQVVYNGVVIELSKEKEKIGPLKFGLLCYSALINLQHHFQIFEPSSKINHSMFSEEDYMYLQNEYIVSLIQNIYSLESAQNFKIDVQDINLFFLMDQCNDQNTQKIFIISLFQKSTDDIIIILEKIINHSEIGHFALPKSRSNKVVNCDECIKGSRFFPIKGINGIYIECGKCEGKGTYFEKVPLDGEVLCRVCNGARKMVIISGEEDPDKTKTIKFWGKCEYCNGIGVILKQEPMNSHTYFSNFLRKPRNP